MHENENKVYIDVNEMADALQKKYRDYRIKKRGPFRILVRKAYDELTEMFAKKYCSREWPAYDDEDEEEEVDVEVYIDIIFKYDIVNFERNILVLVRSPKYYVRWNALKNV